MKKMIIGTLLITSLLSAFEIKVTVENIKNTKGKLYIGLYNQSKGFRDVSKTYKDIKMHIKGKNASYIFKDISKGTYAISVFHDENSNGKLDKNILGIPQEAYGFSKNIRHLLGPADFDETSFIVDKNKNIRIKVEQ